MRLIFVMWAIAVFADGAAAMLLAWEFARRGGLKSADSRYAFILFFALFIARIIRLWSLTNGAEHLPEDFALKSFAVMSVEAVGLWCFYFYVTGKFDGTWQERAGRFVARACKGCGRWIGNLFKRKKDEGSRP